MAGSIKKDSQHENKKKKFLVDFNIWVGKLCEVFFCYSSTVQYSKFQGF